MTHPIEQAADAVERELADLRAKLAQSEADNNGLVELVKAAHENNEALRAKLAVAVKALESIASDVDLMATGRTSLLGKMGRIARAALAQIKGE